MNTKDIAKIVKDVKTALAAVSNLEEWEDVRTRFMGRKGEIAKVSKSMKDLSVVKKKEIGQALNKAKQEIEADFEEARAEFGGGGTGPIDVTLPGKTAAQGSIHPLTHMRLEMIELFRGMGFDIVEGPELETDFYNFEALNIPPDHPARDIQDTFFVDDKQELVMRTHTSNTQVRYMESHEPPFRVIAPGRVFRNEATDPTHEHTFYQLEGFVVDHGITVGHLIHVLKLIFTQFAGTEVDVRLRPNYFPFVEPGYEMDFSCVHCESGDCRVCKGTGWIEMGGCGMIHPNVLKAAGLKDKELTGFAFGFGINRLAMMKYGIDDIRWFQSGDKRFLDQF